MNDREEPPNKISRFEMDSQYLEGEVTDEGQEEWLSEGILTDDDYNPEQSQEHSELNPSIHEDTATSFLEETLDEEQIADPTQTTAEGTTENIEQALDSLENAHESEEEEMALDTLLIRKSDGKAIGAAAPPAKPSPKHSDDGNDTDDLLSVLEDGFKKPKKENAMEVDEENEDYMFEGKKLHKSLQAAKHALSRSADATAEDSDVTECSSDEADSVKKVTKKKVVIHPTKESLLKKSDEKQGGEEPRMMREKTAKVTHSPPRSRTPPKLRSSNRNPQNSNQIENANKKHQIVVTTKQSVNKKTQDVNTHSQIVNKKGQIESKPKKSVNKKPQSVESVHIIKKKPETLFKCNEVFKVQSDVKTEREISSEKSVNMFKEEPKLKEGDHDLKSEQPLMHPEMMDDEFHSDEDSDTGDESLYDDLATTDSENQDDLFTFDIRAERAGEYLPLLGDKAYQLLQEEKARVSEKIDMLRSSLSTLAANSKSQAENLQKASISVAELDAMLKAS